MTHEEIAKTIQDKILGGRVIGVVANQGPMPSFTVLLENATEQRASLTITASIMVNAGPGNADVRPNINFAIGDWRK